MTEINELEYLSLVSKVCTELENHIGLNNKDLAEFIINLANKHKKFEKFKKALEKNGAEFSESFVTNLYRIIHTMKPVETNNDQQSGDDNIAMLAGDDDVSSELKTKKNKFPGLCIPDDYQRVQELVTTEEDKMAANQAMNEV
jgi:ATP-dependent RNA helicase DHX8/PRP22